jgi:hypothetical protein
MLEQNVDMCVAMIYHGIGGRRMIDPRIPRTMKGKLKFLQRAFKTLAVLRPYANDATALLEVAKRLSEKRNDVVHGALSEMTPVDGKWSMSIFDYESPKDQTHWHVVRAFTFSPKDFTEIDRELVPLVGRLAALGLKLNRDLGLHSVIRSR